ncbi:GNAT family N-acetyltransferase [Pelagibacterium montanilacus]|uniref:GNAT family N-acetyltransferase n=1 Tax=Pelagibacterium montanilacus TaxID=2185280 RepID=UPI000F8E34C1|nr:GNAT family N-acetyltransferase [Pelagibacterium montanilacus]
MPAPNWRPVAGRADIDAMVEIAARVHPGYPEDRAVLNERVALAPATCRMLSAGDTALGYLIAHPGRLGVIAPLNSLMGALPEAPDTLYLHDIALLPEARGAGAATDAVAWLTGIALPCGAMSLVAVNNSEPFWTSHGFVRRNDPALDPKLASYGLGTAYMVRLLSA